MTNSTPYFFTWSAQKSAKPLSLAGGKGSRFTTDDGDVWLDLASLVYQVNAGHGESRIIDAICHQAAELCVTHPRAVYPAKTRLAEQLLSIAPPGFSKVFFTLGGAEANENALKIARLVTGRYKAVARYRSYHGATMGAVTLSGDWRRPPVEPGIIGVIHVMDFDGDLRSESQIPRTLELEGNVGAVFVESVVGHNGVLIPPTGYMRSLRDACDRHGALLVCDEVLTGFGRTGRWLALEHFDGVVPDLITLGKAITSGYGTLGAVLVHERVAAHFDENVLCAGLTNYAHPLGVAAANAAIDVYREDRLVERAAAFEALLRDGLQSVEAEWPVVGASRVIGLLSATELDLDAATFARLSTALERQRVLVHLNPRDRVLILSPPLCISEDELALGLALVSKAIEEVTQ